MSTADRTARGQSYALAFYEAVMERSLATLQTISARLGEDPSLVERLQAADVDFSERQPLLEGVFPAETDAPVCNLVYTLMQRGDLGLLGEVAESLHQRMRRAETAAVAVEVTSAVALTDEQRAALVSKIHYRVDPAILGGLIVRVGDKLTDGSLATRMAAMRQALGLATGES
jgi:F-type H+-transporting ATPase subunit delta